MTENNASGKVDLAYKLRFNRYPEFEPILKAGVLYETKDRSFSARNIGYTTANTLYFDSNLQFVTIDSLFQPENINNTYGIRIDEQSNPSDSYTADYKVTSYYLMLNVPVTKKLTVIAGARIEDSKQSLQSFTLTNNPVNVNHDTLNLLPSVNISYNFSEKTLIRAAWGVTINRPEFRELAPFGFYDFNYNIVKKGNENLNDATIQNLELRWEYYPTPSEIITAGVFFKKFINPIETLFIPGGGSGGIKDFSYGNAKSAESMGIEVEIRKSLAGLTKSKFLDDLSLLFNTALIKSKVELGSAAVRQSNNRPMQGQSPYIVNAGIYYKNMKNNLQATILYNVIGKRIFAIGYDVYPDIYEMPCNLLDLTITKGIGQHFELKAGISDLLNNYRVLLQDANQDKVFDKDNDQIIQKYKPGTSYSLGISYKL
jgi:TonB-dependent receptor